MAEYQQYPNSGSLFKNERKTTEKHPDYNGSLNVDGVDFWVSGWIKTAKNGKKFLSLAINPKQPKEAGESLPPLDDDDIPFN